MPHRDPDDFADEECARVYMAGGLRESRRVERALDDRGIDYFVEVEVYHKMLLGVIPREYHGAAFYVRAGDAEVSRHALKAARLVTGMLDEDELA